LLETVKLDLMNSHRSTTSASSRFSWESMYPLRSEHLR